jgi:hypothetical protein
VSAECPVEIAGLSEAGTPAIVGVTFHVNRRREGARALQTPVPRVTVTVSHGVQNVTLSRVPS